ncbi:MAG: hypothetical protein V1723_04530 [Candidatus Uhrbacteria bacterium]
MHGTSAHDRLEAARMEFVRGRNFMERSAVIRCVIEQNPEGAVASIEALYKELGNNDESRYDILSAAVEQSNEALVEFVIDHFGELEFDLYKIFLVHVLSRNDRVSPKHLERLFQAERESRVRRAIFVAIAAGHGRDVRASLERMRQSESDAQLQADIEQWIARL